MGPETKILGDDSIHSWEQIEAVAPNPKRYAKTYLDRRHQASRWHRLPVGGLRWSCLFLGITTLSCVGFVARGLALADCASSAHSRSCLAPACGRAALDACMLARRAREAASAMRPAEAKAECAMMTAPSIQSTRPLCVIFKNPPCSWQEVYHATGDLVSIAEYSSSRHIHTVIFAISTPSCTSDIFF